MPPELKLAPPSLRPVLWLFVLVTVLPLLLIWLISGFAPLPGAPVLIVIGVGLGLTALFWWLMGKTRIERDATGWKVQAFCFYKTRFAADELEAAKRVDFRDHRALKPRWRTNGVGLPGYQAGWFRLRNGEKAFLALTSGTRVLYVPAHPSRDHAILLSCAHE